MKNRIPFNRYWYYIISIKSIFYLYSFYLSLTTLLIQGLYSILRSINLVLKLISKTLLISFVILTVTINQQAYAFKFSAQVCREYNLGANWYCEREEDKEENLPTADDIIKTPNIKSEQKAVMLNQLWELQQKRAVITGERKDLENVLITQNYIAKLGTDFARRMMRLIEMHPQYSKSESYFENVSKEYIEDAIKSQVLSRAKHRYGIAFIYSSSCAYCKRQLPVLASVKEAYGLSIVGISADGGRIDKLEEGTEAYQVLDQNIVDLDVVENQNVESFPTIMLLDAKLNKRVFISKGLTTRDKLENFIYRAINEIEGMEELEGEIEKLRKRTQIPGLNSKRSGHEQ